MMTDVKTAPKSPPAIPSLRLLGVRVDSVTMEQAISSIAGMVHSGKIHHIIPVNPEMVMLARKNAQFREAIERASLVVPDGIGVVYASRYLGRPIPDRVTGVDLTKRVAAVAARRGLRVFLLGAAPGVAELASIRLRSEFSGLIIAGTYAGSPKPEEEAEICRLVAEAAPHILLIAYGAPSQELWIMRNRERLKVPVTICVGGTLDFLSGAVRRAPRPIQRAGLEWLYRLIQQPSRWRRMLALPRFAAAIVMNSLSGRTEREHPAQ